MPYWRRPRYTIETDFGVLRHVDQDEAEAIEHLSPEPYRFVLEHPEPLPGYVYIPLMVLLVSVLLVGFRYLFGG